jgi:formylglycine-generating enzyme required for sulfatase activity/predicted Ser/Thr protein kinase
MKHDTESPPLSSQALPPGTRVEEFVIERVLGSGGFGITYLAKDTRLDRQVVIKENLPAQFCFRDPSSLIVSPRHTHGADVDNFQWSLENFSREASMLASLDHTGIVKVLRSFHACGTAYFVMPFVEGMPFDELIKNRQSKGQVFTEEELRGLLERVLDALGYLHDRGIYHRDIKPGNILITNEGIPVLIDFGSAREQLCERSMTVIESPGYTPFEQLQSRGNVGPWSDLYALGATLVKAIAFKAPPKAADRMMGDPWKGLSAVSSLSHYSSKLLKSVDRAMEVNPAERWQSASDWKFFDKGDMSQREFPREQVITQPASSLSKPLPIMSLDQGMVGDGWGYEIGNGQKIVVRFVPGGEFTMGSSLLEDGYGAEEEAHRVALSHHLWMGETVVTQDQWTAVMGDNPSYFNADGQLPVERVSFIDVMSFLSALNRLVPLPGLWRWHLPTEAQWERACRGGSQTAFAFGNDLSSVQANFDGSYPYGRAPKGPDLLSTSRVRSYPPNHYGLYDMHGNVAEWCQDWFGFYPPTKATDPKGPMGGTRRVVRGGSWSSGAINCRSAQRRAFLPEHRDNVIGFRVSIVIR